MNKDKICREIGKIMVKSLLYEVTAAVKPGLVDRIDSGSHSDMDIFTFIDSVCAIGRFFEEFALIGYDWEDIRPENLDTIRPPGILCEREMFSATGGINTHKGAIFSMSIISACAGYCFKKQGKIDINALCRYASVVGSNSLEDFEKIKTEENLTDGERLYLKYGVKGVRGEVLSGFASVRKYAMEEIRKLNVENSNREQVIVTALLKLIQGVEDTNIIARTDFETLEKAKKTAENCLSQGGAYTMEGRKAIADANETFKAMNISHGGCADLLAVSIAFHFLENM